MTSPLALRIFGWLLSAGLTFLVAAAHAASGYSITPGDEASISVGVTDAEVRDRLGPPAHIRQYLNRPGTTWTYEVRGAPFGRTDLDIDFSADGKVVTPFEKPYGGAH
jgi:hypothetical protein